MRILNRYLFNAIVGSTLVVLLVLVSIGAFVEFVGQLDNVGEGDYDVLGAVQYALLKMPRLAAGMLPVSTLLGALLGLGALATHSELIVMRAAGVSGMRLARSAAVAGLTLAIAGGAVGEFVAPQLDLYARQMKAAATSEGADISGSNAWLRSGDTIFNVYSGKDGNQPGGVVVFRLQDPSSLAAIGRAKSLPEGDGRWSLENYRESRLLPDGVSIGTDIDLGKVDELNDLLAITAVRESSMTAADLWSYAQYLRDNGLVADRYEVAFWGRVAALAGIVVMCLLALPFVFGSLRNAGAGARMLIGVAFGLGYFLLNRTLADTSAFFDVSPALIAWAPTILLLTITLVMLARVR